MSAGDRDPAFESLRRSEELYSRAFIGNPVAMAITNGETQRFIAANERFIQLVGYYRADIIGHTSEELDLWPDRAERSRIGEQLRQGGGTSLVPASFRRKDGAEVECLIGFRLLDTQGAPCVLTVMIDRDDLQAD